MSSKGISFLSRSIQRILEADKLADLCRSDKMKGYGKLKIRGTCDGTDLEIYGDLTVDGYL